MQKHQKQWLAATTDKVYWSKYNIFSHVRDSENSFILNPLTGNADILDPQEAALAAKLQKGESIEDIIFLDDLKSKGYLADENQEKKLFRSKYLDFSESRETDEIQIFFVTNYSCNFACSYCYQDEYVFPGKELTRDVADAFFDYIINEFAGRRKYLTLFGGEPLLPSSRQREIIGYIIDKANGAGLDLCFVTNGYSLEEYIPLLAKGKIREVQVTLDGTKGVHDHRRFLKGGEGTFIKIVNGVDAALSYGIPVNLRMVADKGNINDLPALAAFAIERGWTSNPLFKTQIGRNYELHHCSSDPDLLLSRVSLYEEIYELIKKYPYITEFHKPAYSVAKFLSENGSLPDPLFDSCPACKTEWAFDYTGNIYSCTATVGKDGESLGTFYPVVNKRDEIISGWQERDVTAISKCRDCPVQLACGGGCGSVAKNRSGDICSPDCRPVNELLGLGFAAYFGSSKK